MKAYQINNNYIIMEEDIQFICLMGEKIPLKPLSLVMNIDCIKWK